MNPGLEIEGFENEDKLALHLVNIINQNDQVEDIDEEDRPDILLDQAAEIASDLAAMREIPPAPAKAARVSS